MGRVIAGRWLIPAAALAAAIVVNAGGYLLGLWSAIVWFDTAVHAYTTFAVTLVVAAYLYGAVLSRAQAPAIVLVLVVTAVGLGLGALWEIVEWVYELLTRGNFRRSDTVVDLLVDTGGALVAAVLGRYLPSD